MARVAFYPRRSSPGEVDADYSIKMQIDQMQEWLEKERAAGRAHTLYKTYEDPGGRSDTLNRPVLQAMLRDAKAGKFDLVLVGKWNRFSRHQAQQTIAIEQFRQCGVEVVSATQPVPPGAIGDFMRNVYAFQAQLDLEEIRSKLARGRRERLGEGKLLSGAYPLYGYVWADPHEKRGKSRYVPDPETAPVVRRIYEMALDGLTLRAIGRRLMAEGVPTPSQVLLARGLLPRGRSHNDVWHLVTLKRILSNPAYMGRHSGGKTRTVLREVRHPLTGEVTMREVRERVGADEEGRVWLPSEACPPLVSEDDFQAVQERLRRNQQEAHRNTHHPELVLLRGGDFLRCGHCGRRMTYRYDPRISGYRYRCPYYSSMEHARDADTPIGSVVVPKVERVACEGRGFTWRAEELDALVWRFVVAQCERPELIEAKFAEWQADRAAGRTDEQDRLAAAEAALAKAKARVTRYSLLAVETEDDDLRTRWRQEAEGEQRHAREVEEEVAALQRVLAGEVAYERAVADVVALTQAARSKLGEATIEEKRVILHAFGVRVRVWQQGQRAEGDIEISWQFGPGAPVASFVLPRTAVR